MTIPSNGIILVRGESGVLIIPSSAGLATDLSLDSFSSVLAFPTTRKVFVSDEKGLPQKGGKLSRRASRKHRISEKVTVEINSQNGHENFNPLLWL